MAMTISKDQFQQIVLKCLDELPDEYMSQIAHIPVVVQDEPTPEQLEELDCDPEDPPLGCFLGTPDTEKRLDVSEFEPETIFIFQRPVEEVCDTVEEIEDEVRATLLHEIAHHFGIEEDEMPESVA